MCNLYSVTKGQKAIIDLVRAMRDTTGNMPPMFAIFPNAKAPIVRTAPDGVRELSYARWGVEPPVIPGAKSHGRWITNIRNSKSRFWLPHLKNPEQRALIPASSFSEPDNTKGERSQWTWFARDDARTPFFFPGIWKTYEGDRGTKKTPEIGTHTAFAFLTTDAGPDTAAVHPDASPVILWEPDDLEMWLHAPWELAQTLQRPPPAGALKTVAVDTKQDPGT